MLSFRHRLALFFVLVVVVPMLAVAVMSFRVIGQSEQGKSDAAIAAQHDVAQRLFAGQRARANRAIRDVVAGDRVLRPRSQMASWGAPPSGRGSS